jgi:hypothetical protein
VPDNYGIQKQWRDWCMWQCGLPILVLLLIWPLGRFVAEATDAFHQAFGTGDLLIFSALLLISMAVEFRRIQLVEPRLLHDGWVESNSEAALFAAIIAFLFLGGIKVDVMRANLFESPDGMSKLTAYAVFSVAATLAAVSFTLRAFWRTRAKLLGEDS